MQQVQRSRHISKHLVECDLWNSASASNDVAWITALSLNLLSYKAVLRFGETIYTALNLLNREGVEEESFCFSQKLTHRQSTVEDALSCWRNQSPELKPSVCFFVQVFWTDPKYSQNVTNFMDSDCSLLQNKFLHSVHIFICFARR
jgi:hypothetical protein